MCRKILQSAIVPFLGMRGRLSYTQNGVMTTKSPSVREGHGDFVINKGPTVQFDVDDSIAMPLPAWGRFCQHEDVLCVVNT